MSFADSNPAAADSNSPINPYAAPAIEHTAQVTPTPGGVWRSGNQLIMHRNAVLPDVCVKSNDAANGYRLKRKLSWHHPAVLFALISPIIYIILAAVLSKRATIEIGLSERWRGIRRRRMWTAAILGFGGIAAFFSPLWLDGLVGPNSPWVGLLMLVGIVAGLIGLIIASAATRMVKPMRIDDQYVYLSGLHPDYLDRFESITLPG